MSDGFQFFKQNGALQFSSDDNTFVLLDEFVVAAGSGSGSRSYPGYDSSRVFATVVRDEPPNTSSTCPTPTYSFGHTVWVTGNSGIATVNWTYVTYVQYQASGGYVGYASYPTTNSTLYVYAI